MLLVHRWPCTEIIVLWRECISNSGARWIASSQIELHHTVRGNDKLKNSRTVSALVTTTEINLALAVVEQETERQNSKCSSFTFLKSASTSIGLTQMVQINRLSRRLFPSPDKSVLSAVFKAGPGRQSLNNWSYFSDRQQYNQRQLSYRCWLSMIVLTLNSRLAMRRKGLMFSGLWNP